MPGYTNRAYRALADKTDKGYEMWAIDLYLADGSKDVVYCTSRQEARDMARFYRTMTEGTKAVIRTKVRKANES